MKHHKPKNYSPTASESSYKSSNKTNVKFSGKVETKLIPHDDNDKKPKCQTPLRKESSKSSSQNSEIFSSIPTESIQGQTEITHKLSSVRPSSGSNYPSEDKSSEISKNSGSSVSNYNTPNGPPSVSSRLPESVETITEESEQLEYAIDSSSPFTPLKEVWKKPKHTFIDCKVKIVFSYPPEKPRGNKLLKVWYVIDNSIRRPMRLAFWEEQALAHDYPVR